MNTFGIAESDVRVPLSTLRASASEPALTLALARAAWSMITEPGDAVAGMLRDVLGSEEALGLLLGGASATDMAAALGAPEQVTAVNAALARWRPRIDSASLVRKLNAAATVGAELLLPHDARWMMGVNDLGVHAPGALWVRTRASADTSLLGECSIALVGARAATSYGEHVTIEAASGLVGKGFAVVSGAAYGIDGAAHRATLGAGGMTVAFLAGGVDRFYPAGHHDLLVKIAEDGAVCSELPCGEPPTRWRFLQRNRMIAAAADVSVVCEAGLRSGSLNTARHAATLGRPLGAVPGPVTSPASAGCHHLLRETDAQCVTDADEMAELHPRWAVGGSDTLGRDRPSNEVRVLDALSARSARDVDDLARRTGADPATVRATLGTLNLEGAVQQRGSGWVKS